ncbi:MAG: LysR family transcriptional regulator [Proteobacteria bacterium]|nr:LysR family transcriptional regulator [Pseudomonadota bacterium]
MTRRLPSLTALRSFEAAARHASMSRAAEMLGVTHGAVSRQVRGLEAQLGILLLENRRGRLQLTAAGSSLMNVLDDAFGRIARGIDAICADAASDITVSSFGSFAMRWLIPRLHLFQSARPDIVVRLTTSDTVANESARGGFDLAVRVGAAPWPRDVVVVPLFAERAGPVLAPALAPQFDPADPQGAALLHTKTRADAWPEWFAARGLAAPPAKDGRNFEHFYFMLEAALAGLGVAIGFWHLVADDVRGGRLAAPFGFAPTGRHYAALLPLDARPAALAFSRYDSVVRSWNQCWACT